MKEIEKDFIYLPSRCHFFCSGIKHSGFGAQSYDKNNIWRINKWEKKIRIIKEKKRKSLKV